MAQEEKIIPERLQRLKHIVGIAHGSTPCPLYAEGLNIIAELEAALSSRSDEMERMRDLLGDVLHLWIDSYIDKCATSSAPESISQGVFDKIDDLLQSQGIDVGFCGAVDKRHTRKFRDQVRAVLAPQEKGGQG